MIIKALEKPMPHYKTKVVLWLIVFPEFDADIKK